MLLLKEAAYLYVYSRELVKINRKLKRLSRKAEKHAHNYATAASENKRIKHKKRHYQTTADIHKLISKHNQVMSSLKHHLINYHHSLRKEHAI